MKKQYFIIVIAGLSIGNLVAQVPWNYFGKSNWVLDGYDAVSYFQEKPVQGKDAYQYTYKGATFRFASEANLEQFKTDPQKYVPQYGGWCAYAMGKDGSEVSVNPLTYKILDGHLYLFYNKGRTNTLLKWNQDEANLKSSADQHWSELVKKTR